jgi:hypothetical protein
VPGLGASHGQKHDVAGKRHADHPAVGAKLLDDVVVERLTGLGVVLELFCVDFPLDLNRSAHHWDERN